MAQFALVVGIASFAEAKFAPIPFAESDALKIQDALLRIGFASGDIELLINGDATCDAVRHAVKQICGTAKPDDAVLLYFSGHGLSYSGANHFICYDTTQATPPAKTLPMRELLEEIGGCQSKRVLLFLDCCHSGLKLPEKGVKGFFSRFSESELQQFFSQQDFKAAFCSCRDNEISYTSDDLKQSVWTHYLLKALNAEVPDLIEEKRYLNGAKLQDYLFEQVPQAVKRLAAYSSPQTPVILHKQNHSPLIADLSKVIAANMDARAITARDAALFFQSDERQRISSLEGFREDDEEPDAFDDAGNNLVMRAAKPEIAALRSKFFNECRRLKYKVAQIDQTDGDAIATPDFKLDFSAEQDRDSPGQCIIRTQARILDDTCIEKPHVAEFFEKHFSSLILYPRQTMDIHKTSMVLEDLDYVAFGRVDADYTFCTFSVPAKAVDVRVEAREITFSSEEIGVLQLVPEVRSILGRLAVDGVDFFRGEPGKPRKPPVRRW